jgi:hypothetical protein
MSEDQPADRRRERGRGAFYTQLGYAVEARVSMGKYIV